MIIRNPGCSFCGASGINCEIQHLRPPANEDSANDCIDSDLPDLIARTLEARTDTSPRSAQAKPAAFEGRLADAHRSDSSRAPRVSSGDGVRQRLRRMPPS